MTPSPPTLAATAVREHDNSDESSTSGEYHSEPNWELLKETLGPDAFAALQQHMISTDNNKNNKNKDSINNVPPPAEVVRNNTALPKSNREYGKKEYWDNRFAQETDFEWLVSFLDVKTQLEPFLSPDSRVLIVGCGNSSFSADLYDAGYPHLCSLDYSPVVIDAMRARHAETRPSMEWIVMDMTQMDALDDASFDAVIDKAAMDALMTAEEDVWNPAQSVIDASRRMCHHIARLLTPGGHHLHISFAQPHFRKKYLLGWHPKTEGEDCVSATGGDDSYSDEFGWSYRVETIAGDDNDGCFHHFLYIMTKEDKKI